MRPHCCSGLRVLGALRTAKLEDLPELEMIAEEANSNWAEGDLEVSLYCHCVVRLCFFLCYHDLLL